MASSRGMKGADYCIVDGRLRRYTGCQWERGAALGKSKPRRTNLDLDAYLYVGADTVYLLRIKDTFKKRRGDATVLVAEGKLGDLWDNFIAYGRMQL